MTTVGVKGICCVYERFLCGSEANIEPSAPMLEETNNQKKILSTTFASICHSREYRTLLSAVGESACCVDLRLLPVFDRCVDTGRRLTTTLFCWSSSLSIDRPSMSTVSRYSTRWSSYSTRWLSSLSIDRLSMSTLSRYLTAAESCCLATSVEGLTIADVLDDVADVDRKTRLTDDGTLLPESLRRKILVTMTAITSATDTINIVRLNRIPNNSRRHYYTADQQCQTQPVINSAYVTRHRRICAISRSLCAFERSLVRVIIDRSRCAMVTLTTDSVALSMTALRCR